jgi:hydrogenase expression/formation protein HypC
MPRGNDGYRIEDVCVEGGELREGDQAMVDVGGVRKEISLALVDGIAVGDYVILHVGYAIQKLDPEEAEKTLALFAELGENMGAAPA